MRLLALLLCCSWVLSQATPSDNLWVRVLLEEGKEARLEIGDYQLKTPNGTSNQRGGTVLLQWQQGQVVLNGTGVGPWAELVGNGFSLGNRSYRGNILAIAEAGRLLLINRVWLEDYLKGVVPGEVPRTFPSEVLKAQAILARTYAIYRLNPRGNYDLCDDERCQVYLGFRSETPEHTAAIEATRGFIVSYNNRPISAVYHSDSGGMTAASEEVWGGALPYLIPRLDPYAQGPRSTWLQTLDPGKVAQAVGEAIGQVQSLQVLAYSPSGRPTRLRVVGSTRSVEYSGPAAGRLLRLLGLPSTRVVIEGLQVTGRGAGHGVGLSQWGARGFALQGWDYRQILGHYYPGTFLANFSVVQHPDGPVQVRDLAALQSLQ